MDKETLIKVVAILDKRIELYAEARKNCKDKNDQMMMGVMLFELIYIRDQFQDPIDADVAAMETGMGM
jgi:hypothetical protein